MSKLKKADLIALAKADGKELTGKETVAELNELLDDATVIADHDKHAPKAEGKKHDKHAPKKEGKRHDKHAPKETSETDE